MRAVAILCNLLYHGDLFINLVTICYYLEIDAMDGKRFENYRFYILLALLFLTPLFYLEPCIFGISMADSFNFPKRYLTQFLSLVLLLLFILELCIRRRIRIQWPTCLLPYMLFLAWSCLSLFYCVNLHVGWGEVIRWGSYGIIYLSVLSISLTASRRSFFISAIMVSATIGSLLTLMQHLGLDPSHLKGGTQRVYSTFGNPNYIASYLAVVLPIGYWGWICPNRKKVRTLIYLPFSLICTSALLVTGSRGGIAALSISTVLVMLALSKLISKRRLLILILTIAVIILSLLVPFTPGRQDRSPFNKFYDLSGSAREGIAWRQLVWSISWEMVEERPLLGAGVGSFNLLYLDHLAEFLKNPDNQHYLPQAEGGIDYTHNEYLQILVELGLVGLLLLGWFLTTLIVAEWRTAKRTGEGEWINSALLTGCIALLLHGLVSFPFHMWPSATTFFIFSGMLVAGGSRDKVIRLESLPIRILALLLGVLIALLSSSKMTSTILSEIYFSRGLNAFYRNNPKTAMLEFRKATTGQPQNGRAHFYLGLCLAAEQKRPESASEMLTALKTYSRQAIYVQLGRVYREMGNSEAADFFLNRALAMLPKDADAWLEKGNLLFGRGDFDGASRHYEKALALRPAFFTAARNLAVSYDALGQQDKALAIYERAVELEPDEADLYVNMGAILGQRGNEKEARSLWQKALSLDPDNINARRNLERIGDTETTKPD